MYSLIVLQAEQGGMNPLISQLILFGSIILIFYFFIILPQNRRRKKEEMFRNSLQKGDKVITAGGIYGTITKVNEKDVVLEVDKNVKIKVLKSSIVSYANQ